MSSRLQAVAPHVSPLRRRAFWRLTPLSQALTALLIAGSATGAAQAQSRAFSPGWFSDKNAVQSTAQRTGRMPDGSMAGIGSAARQQAQSRQQLQRSLDNLNRTAAAVAAQQAAQAAARAAAAANGGSVPDGLVEGGLWAAEGGLAKWEGAKAAQPGVENGRQIVTIEQTQSRAILNWDTFNVGRNTTVQFKQGADDAVLNRVVGASAKPSQIQGAIKADGTVMVVNQNGVIFTGTSQVNVRNLVAAAGTITDAQFRDQGLYSDGTRPSFTAAGGKIEVQAGARIETATPATAARGGGYVLLLGSEVDNAGVIHTPKGQTALAAGDSFVIRRGQGTEGNLASTTLGNEVVVSGDGRVRNSGLIQAPLGDATLTGRRVEQAGTVVSTTSVDSRGTIHLKASGTDAAVTLLEGAVSAILVDAGGATALDGQRGSLLMPVISNNLPLQGADVYRRDLSLIQVESQGAIDVRGGSLTLATGGQVAMKADGRTLVRDGARIDVGGAIGVAVSMESNNLKINIQGNEQRDAPGNRDGKVLNNSDVWLDVRDLVLVPTGTGGYDGDRWYTAGGLLEVGGYLGTRALPVSHWLAQGGMVRFEGGDVVTQAGSTINLAGGTLDVQEGMMRQTWLRGQDGRLYVADRAPGDLLYTGLYQGYEAVSRRWGEGATRRFRNPLIAPETRYESGYTVGRDAGVLVVSTRSAVLEGELSGQTYQGERQTRAPQAGVDGFSQSHLAVARGAQLVVGTYMPFYDRQGSVLKYQLSASGSTIAEVTIGHGAPATADGTDLLAATPTDRERRLYLNADLLNAFELGAVRIAAGRTIAVDAGLQTTAGGEITLLAPQIDVRGDLVSRGGLIQAGNVLLQPGSSGRLEELALAPETGQKAGLRVASGVVLDVRGTWSNQKADLSASAGLPVINAGRIALRGTGDVALAGGSLADASSGAAVLVDGKFQAGRGGSITIEANAISQLPGQGGVLALDGEVRGYGGLGGGTLTLGSGGRIVVGGARDSADDPLALHLAPALFQRGFANYDLNGHQGVTVAEGATVDVAMPVYRLLPVSGDLPPSGADPLQALTLWMPPRYAENPVRGVMTPRAGASLALRSDRNNEGGAIVVEAGARVAVDPGRSIRLSGAGQMTVLGRLEAAGGLISIDDARPSDTLPYASQANPRSVWIGEHAVLDVAGRSQVAVDAQGRRYGVVQAGGVIEIGGRLDWEDDAYVSKHPMDRHLIVRPGAVLDASGSQALLDLPGRGAVQVASNGGTIVLSSASSLYLDGGMHAAAGGPGAVGGTLGVSLGGGFYARSTAQPQVLAERELTLTQTQGPALLPEGLQPGEADAALAYGLGRLGVDQITAGGFGNLAVFANVRTEGSIDLHLPQSLRLSGRVSMSDAAPAGSTLRLGAAHVLLNEAQYTPLPNGDFVALPAITPLAWTKRQHAAEIRADLLDVRGIRDFRNFDDVRMDVSGDVRLLANTAGLGAMWPTQLLAPDRLTMTAAQIYPETGASGRIAAGVYFATQGSLNNPDAVLTLRRTEGELAAVPYSAFGSLALGAPTVLQGGVVRAPLGRIEIGLDQSIPAAVRFLPGSLTSISGQNLVMPYGGTVDGLKYLVAGSEITPTAAGGADVSAARSRMIRIAAASIETEAGAVLDLSGGGELTGAGFVRGRGGSVDVLKYAMADANPGFAFSKPGSAVYAVVPGFQGGYAPIGADAGAGNPSLGQRVAIGAGVPGLPAGMYTLLPSSYALLPGAFRVEVGQAGVRDAGQAARTRGGSWVTTGQVGALGADASVALASPLLLTPADVVRRHAQYNETSYNTFLLADAARTGNPRAMLTTDAGLMRLTLAAGAGQGQKPALRFDGEARFGAAQGSAGVGGTLVLDTTNANLEVLASGQTPVLNGNSAVVIADALNALRPSRMVIGGPVSSSYGQGALSLNGTAGTVLVRSGATLAAPELIFTVGEGGRGIVVEQGATLTTLGLGDVRQDARAGYYYVTNGGGSLVISNGLVNIRPPSFSAKADIDLGACLTICQGVTRIVSEGTIATSTNGAFTLRESVEYGTRNLMLGVSAVNLGTSDALAQAAAAGKLPPGMVLNQTVLSNLLRGGMALGAPPLESLILNAGESVNVFGAVSLDTRDAVSGRTALQRLVLGTPALYGYGAAGESARISTREFVWAGSVGVDRSGGAMPSTQTPQAPGGAVLDRLGDGSLTIAADIIRFEASPYTLPASLVPANRLALGFASVALEAAQWITSSATGGLSVYHKQEGYVAGEGWRYRGGDLAVRTPLLTGEAGSTMTMRAGGAITAVSTGAAAPARDALGATLNLDAQRIALDTRVALPSGKLVLKAGGDITLGGQAVIDVSGREVRLFDVLRYSWGGDVELQSLTGNITQSADAVIDLSARHNRAGRLQAIALGADAGRVDLAGRILGTASGGYDAGGTMVPYDSAEVTVRAQTLADFAGLNMRLNEGGVFGARRFQIKQGDLAVGDEVRARHVEIALDGGSLTVNGRIDASGVQVGSIRLAAQQDLTINGVLDAHGAGLRVDSYGKIIDSVNRAIVDLTSRTGTLTLGAGAQMDLRSGTEAGTRNDGVPRGTLDLNARRLGGGAGQGAIAGSGDGANDVAIAVAGTPAILGAKTVAVNAFRRYDDAPLAALPDVTGKRPQLITQGYLDGIDVQSQAFMTAALGNTALSARLAGLGGYRLRPGVEVASATPDGDLTVSGDIDLSNYRYGPAANRSVAAWRGYGEPGVLVLRAGGNLNIHGSINDGFAPPPDSPDDAAGWQLVEGRHSAAVGQTPFGQDLVVPIDGVTLEAGTAFPAGRALNYDLPAQAGTYPAGTVLPVTAGLAKPLSLPAGLVLTGDVVTADGSVLRAGTVLPQPLVLAAGTQLGAGFTLRSDAALQALTWPKGVVLPVGLVASGRIVLARGALIPSQTKVELLDDKPVNLRPVGPDGKQGRNWALAPMLGEGATAWDVTAVAGADLGSADVRARNVLGTGDIILADSHLGVLSRATQTTKSTFVGEMVLTEEGARDNGKPVGTPVQEVADEWGVSVEEICSWGNYCVAGQRKMTAAGSAYWNGDDSATGRNAQEIADEWLVSVEEICKIAEHCAGGGRVETVITRDYQYGDRTPSFSVLRTGTGDLSLFAGRDVGMMSVYGVYTAGAPTSLGALDARYNLPRSFQDEHGVLGLIQLDGKYDAALAAYRAWYPAQGGNLTVAAGRDVFGDSWNNNSANAVPFPSDSRDYSRFASAATGNWLWRQGSVGTPGVVDIDPSWWINFGAYTSNSARPNGYPVLVGFTGFGTLGGGNLSISAGRDAGVRDARGDALINLDFSTGRSQGLVAAVGSTGRVVNGDMVLTGGGDLDLRIGGALNPVLAATQQTGSKNSGGGLHGGSFDHLDLNGVLVNLRGALTLSAGRVGAISLTYGDGAGLRATDPYAVGGGMPLGGPRIMLGDSTAWFDTRGDLVLGGAGDPGRVGQVNSSPYRLIGSETTTTGGGEGWFSLWTPSTAINLFSAGGNLTPLTANNSYFAGSEMKVEATHESNNANGQFYTVYPSILRAVAPGGNVILAANAGDAVAGRTLMLAPSPTGQLELLAGGSILANQAHGVSMSGADTATPTPLRPAFAAWNAPANGALPMGNVSPEGNMAEMREGKPLFVFGPNSPLNASLHDNITDIARFYAVSGDVVGLRSGHVTNSFGAVYGIPRTLNTWYEAALPISVQAGRDILGLDALALHNNATDVSLINAGRDIVHANVTVAGPGLLLLQSGRQLRQEDQASVISLGPILRGDARPGASLAVLAGIGSNGPDYNGFLTRYLDASRTMASGLGLDAQADRIAQAYGGELTLKDWLHAAFGYSGTDEEAPAELVRQQGLRDADPALGSRNLAQAYRQESTLYLVNWLRDHHGYQGGEDGARAALDALAPALRDGYARQLYFAELKSGGREYNDADGPRFGSYLRGRRAIAALFPETDANGAAILYQGDFIMYGGAGLRTRFGGDIQVLTPGGSQVLGIEGVAPPASAGVVTQGQGDIQLYSQGSVLLGQSRIMTTFGGHIQAWSSQGDINAGRGAKTTVLYTPPRRVYDAFGNVTLSPTVPSTGAGIATLAPIPEVPAGDVDLIAPLGTIDAGEAGIRVSGNVNVAALQVVNAANIQVQGDAVGLPPAVVVNTGALASASAASTAAAGAAQDSVQRAQNQMRQNQASVFSVQILGFGNEPPAGSADPVKPRAAAPDYRPDGVVQVMGADGRPL